MSPSKIQLETKLDAPDLPEGHELYTVLASALRRRPAPPSAGAHLSLAFWPGAHFQLDRVTLYREATEEEQQRMLEACGRSIFAEAFFIEKSGMYFAAKMCLLAESTQERMLYSLFGADEAVHFSWLAKYVAAETVANYLHDPFITWLDARIREEDRLTLVYLVQVILEGWGLSHYRALASDCRDAGFITVCESIIRDEARHHGSGLIVSAEQRLSASRMKHLAELVIGLCRMIQAGPQMVAANIERVTGHLSRAQKSSVFAELGCEAETEKKLDLIKTLIRPTSGAEQILGELERAGAMRPYSAAECAAVSSR